MDSIPVGYVGRIPIRNLWLLMLYASELYRELDAAARDVEDNPEDIPDLVATMLTRCVERRLQRNLTQGYRERKEILGRVRGCIDHLTTEAHMLLERGKVACSFDELSTDTPRNRSVRAALLRLSRLVKDRELGTRCATLAAHLWEAGVTGEPPDRRRLSLETFGRNDAADRQIVSLAKLAFDLALPTEDRALVIWPRQIARNIGSGNSLSVRSEASSTARLIGRGGASALETGSNGRSATEPRE